MKEDDQIFGKTITSIKDEMVQLARSLHSSKERLTTRKFLVEGEEQILWAMDSPCHVSSVFVHDKLLSHSFTKELKEKKIPFFFVSDGIMKKITDTSYLIPFVGIVEEAKISELQDDFIIVLDGVQDFGNIGTIIRTAEAFGIKEFVATDSHFDWYYKKAIDASRGKIFPSYLHRFNDPKQTILFLKQHGYQIAVTSVRESLAQSFVEVEMKPIAIVFGNETRGISPEMEKEADLRIQIPMSGSVESLNVGVAAGISLYEIKIKWILAMLTKKIQESIGRDLSIASRWMRLVFDAKLREITPFTAEQAIAMMILKCELSQNRDTLALDTGAKGDATFLDPLIDQKFISEEDNRLTLTIKGEEALAKIWCLHELTENLAFKGISDSDKDIFLKTFQKICDNCSKIVPFS